MSIEAIVNEFSAVAANPKGQLKAYKDCLLYTSDAADEL